MSAPLSALLAGPCDSLTFTVLSKLCGQLGYVLSQSDNTEPYALPRADVVFVPVRRDRENSFLWLQTLRNQATAPILALTSSSDVESRVLALKYGAIDCLTSPFCFEELKARIHAALCVWKHKVTGDTLAEVGTLEMCRFALRTEWARSKRHKRPVSLLFWGWHSETELPPSMVAQLVQSAQKSLRQEDMLFRVSVNEFAACLPETDFSGARVVAQRLWKKVRGTRPSDNTLSIHVGGTCSQVERIRHAEALFQEAKASYQHLKSIREPVFWDVRN